MPIRFLDEPRATDPAPKAPADPQDIRFGLQGLTFGGAEEIEAGLRTGFGLLGDYPATVADIRSQLAAARKEYPYRTTAAEIGGAVIPTVGLGLLSGGTAAPAGLARMAAIGAGEAGAYEFGTGEGGIRERLRGVPQAAAIGAVAAPALALGVGKVTQKAGQFLDFARRMKGERAARAVEQEFQSVMRDSGMTADELIDAARRGSIPADMSQTARETLRSYITFLDDPMRQRLLDRPAELRGAAIGKTQEILTGDVDANVISQFSRGVEAAKKDASDAYDEIFDTAGKLNAPVRAAAQRVLNSAPQAVKDLNAMMRAKTGKESNLITKGPKGLVKLNRVPTLREAEYIRRAINDMKNKAYKDGKGGLGEAYGDLERTMRGLLDDASPDLSQTRAVWSRIEKNAEHFDVGRKAFGKSSDDIELAFEDVVAQGDDALAAFRAGMMDAIRRKMETGRATSLPKLLTSMEAKEAKIFQTIFPADTYDEVYGALDRAARSQETRTRVLQGSQTAETLARRAEQGKGIIGDLDMGDVAALTTKSPVLLARTIKKAVSGIGTKYSDAQKRQVAQLLMEENPDLLEAALKDKGAFPALQKAALRIAKSIETGTLRGAGVAAGQVSPLFGQE